MRLTAALARRAVLVVSAYVLAALAAALFLVWIGFNNGRLPEFSARALALWGAIVGFTAAQAALTMLPALLGAVAAEAYRLRAAWPYAVAGAAGGALAYILVLRDMLDLNDNPLAVSIGCGLVAALVYWLVAGRTAGLPRSVP